MMKCMGTMMAPFSCHGLFNTLFGWYVGFLVITNDLHLILRCPCCHCGTLWLCLLFEPRTMQNYVACTRTGILMLQFSHTGSIHNGDNLNEISY